MAFGADIKKDQGLRVNTRPGSVDPIAAQRLVFPIESWEFDDPNRTAEPELRLKAPWKLVASSITAEAIEAALIEATQVVIGYEGADPDNPVEGDRRLVIKAFILTLQHYDTTLVDWVDDIALGGYDPTGNFKPYVTSRGLMHPEIDISNLEGGFGYIPFDVNDPTSRYKDVVVFSNLNGEDPLIGETVLSGVEVGSSTFNGKPMYRNDGVALKYLGDTYSIDAITGENYLLGLGQSGYTSISGLIQSFRFSTPDSTTTTQIGALSAGLAITNTIGATSNIYVTIIGGIFIRGGKLELDLRYYMAGVFDVTHTVVLMSSVVNDTVYSVNIPLTLECNISISGSTQNYLFSVVGPTVIDGAFTGNVIDTYNYLTTKAATSKYTDYSVSVSNQLLIPVNQNAEFTDVCVQTFVQNPCDFTESQGVQLSSSVDAFKAWSAGTRYWALFDDEEDIVITPKSEGSVVLIGGRLIDENNSVVITGPPGATGATGPTGDTGPQGDEGPSFFDGGTWDTIYVPDQTIDGGGWS
jgi:hypothetical protein